MSGVYVKYVSGVCQINLCSVHVSVCCVCLSTCVVICKMRCVVKL